MTATRTELGECRQCRSFCDKMVEPRGCIELGCRFLYSYVDRLTGAQYVGCLQEVFSAEIDLLAVLEPGGRFGRFGGQFIPETLVGACQGVEREFKAAWADPAFRARCLAETPVRLAGPGSSIPPMVDRLRLTPRIIETVAQGCEQLAAMPDILEVRLATLVP